MPRLDDRYLNQKVEVVTKEGAVLVSGVLTEVLSDESILITNNSEYSSYKGDEFVELRILRETIGSKLYLGKIKEIKPDHLILHELKLSESFGANNRKFFRYDVLIPSEIFIIDKDTMEIIEGDPHKVLIADISLGGIMMKTVDKIDVDTEFFITIPIENKNVDFITAVRRIIKQEENVCYLGCEFVYTDPHQQDALCRYLFELDRMKKAR